jgi:excinuclease UvrABC nuclease subunit
MKINAHDLSFLEKEWHTPNTFDRNFKAIPKLPGVYMLVCVNIDSLLIQNLEREILYIGSAKNLLQRYTGHNVLRIVKLTHGYIQFHFKECENYYQYEIELIKEFNPIFNKQHNA